MSVHTMFWEVNHTTTFAKTIYTNGLYQQKVDVGMLNAVKTIFVDVSSIGPLSERKVVFCLFCSDKRLTLEMSAKQFFTVFNIPTSTFSSLFCLLRQRRPTLVHMRTSIPIHTQGCQ